MNTSTAVQSRFTKLDAQGHDLADDATDHVAFRHIATGKLFHVAKTKRVLDRLGPDGVGVEGDAEHVAASVRLFDRKDWQLATLPEQELIRDITRFNPACDPIFGRDIKPDWYWTRSPDASDPSGCAWLLYFFLGYSYIFRRDLNRGFVVAVAPAGQ